MLPHKSHVTHGYRNTLSPEPPTHAHSASLSPRSPPQPPLPTAALCPAGTTGVNVISGCTPNPGFQRVTITPTTIAPFYAVNGVNGAAVPCAVGFVLQNNLPMQFYETVPDRCIACFSEEVCDAGTGIQLIPILLSITTSSRIGSGPIRIKF